MIIIVNPQECTLFLRHAGELYIVARQQLCFGINLGKYLLFAFITFTFMSLSYADCIKGVARS